MKIIITNYFLENFKKECKNIKIEDIIKKINIESKNFISLKYPFYKIKLNINNKTYRLIIFSNENLVKILFINIFNKKDKNFGENINWKISSNKIIKFYEKNLEDIEQNKFIKYNQNGELI